MKCDRCDNEATVHEVTVHKGKKVEKHLCEQCAKGDGIAVQTPAPIHQLLQKFVVPAGGTAAPAKQACPTCGTAYSDFRQHGMLGCPDCYREFEEQLGPLLERAHEGATHHVGKAPKRAEGSLDRQRIVAALRRQLNEAIAAEQYEKAAQLRDQLRTAGGECGAERAGNADASAGAQSDA